jgi:hypothetical protein
VRRLLAGLLAFCAGCAPAKGRLSANPYSRGDQIRRVVLLPLITDDATAYFGSTARADARLRQLLERAGYSIVGPERIESFMPSDRVDDSTDLDPKAASTLRERFGVDAIVYPSYRGSGIFRLGFIEIASGHKGYAATLELPNRRCFRDGDGSVPLLVEMKRHLDLDHGAEWEVRCPSASEGEPSSRRGSPAGGL